MDLECRLVGLERRVVDSQRQVAVAAFLHRPLVPVLESLRLCLEVLVDPQMADTVASMALVGSMATAGLTDRLQQHTLTEDAHGRHERVIELREVTVKQLGGCVGTKLSNVSFVSEWSASVCTLIIQCRSIVALSQNTLLDSCST